MNNYFEYDSINRYNFAYPSPSTVHCSNTALVKYFSKYLLEQVFSRYEFTLPDSEGWDLDYFRYVLFCWGHGAVIKTRKYGVIFQACTLGGYNVNYMPSYALIANPLLPAYHEPIKIHADTEIIKMQPNFTGIMDMIKYYADLMALTSEAIGMNIINSKLAFVFAAQDKNVAESMKKLYDVIQAGNPAVFADKHLFDNQGRLLMQYFSQNLKDNYIAPELFDSLKSIEDKFNTAVGFNNSNTDKKERLIKDEVNSNNEEIRSKASLWKECIEKSFNRVNKMFGLNLSVKFRQLESTSQLVKNGGDKDEP